MTSPAYIIGAMRTPVAARNGAFAALNATKLGQYAIEGLLKQNELPSNCVDHCILGNALYAGGNPARISALAAGIPESTPALTIDTQCCGGVDSVLLASNLIEAGRYDFILAGGVESFSTSPRRFIRSTSDGPDIEYKRPPFSPWPQRDPDMLDAAAELAKNLGITRLEQEEYARNSHQKALAAASRLANECIPVSGLQADSFTRSLNERAQSRLPILAGDDSYGITASTTAVEADASAICAVVSEHFLTSHPALRSRALRILGGSSIGCDPAMPGLAPVDAIKNTLEALEMNIVHFNVFEIMEAFASQAIACIKLCEIDQALVNWGGGALARGHPIGASGAINIVRLYQEMISNHDFKYGLAAIAGAGGLGSTLVLAK